MATAAANESFSTKNVGRFDPVAAWFSPCTLDFVSKIEDNVDLTCLCFGNDTNIGLTLSTNNIYLGGIDPFRIGVRRKWRHELGNQPENSQVQLDGHRHAIMRIVEDIMCLFRGEHVEKGECVGVLEMLTKTENNVLPSNIVCQIRVGDPGKHLSRLSINKKFIPTTVGPSFEYTSEHIGAPRIVPFVVPMQPDSACQLLRFHAVPITNVLRARNSVNHRENKALISVEVTMHPSHYGLMRDLNVQASLATLVGGDVNAELVSVKIRPKGFYNTLTKIITWTTDSVDCSAEKPKLQFEAIVDLTESGGLMSTEIVSLPVIVRGSSRQVLNASTMSAFSVISDEHMSPDVVCELSGFTRIEYKFSA